MGRGWSPANVPLILVLATLGYAAPGTVAALIKRRLAPA
jgi:hypothetical protein